ncbi:Gag/polymerase/env Polyprotein, partial [Phytophthora palmivora]
KSDDIALFDLILEHANVQQRFHRMSQENASKTDSKGSKVEKKPQRAASSKPPPPRTSTPAAAASGGTTPSTPRPTRAPPHDGCLVCKGSHWMNDCPVATDAQREEALKQFREAKEKRLSARSKMDGLSLPRARTPDDISTLTQLLDRAVANGLPAEYVDAVRELLEAFPDVWREAVGADPPANIDPLQVTIQSGAVPHRSSPRKYAPMQAQFIRDYVKSLVDSGLVEQNNASRWACAVVPVRKPGTQDKFRLTIDYRPVNKVTVPIAGTMPSTATTLNALEGMKVFGRVNFTQGFWQLPLHEDSREVFSFVTPDGVYSPTRVPQGAMDSALHFQSQIQAKLAPLIPKSALVWVDDVILFAPTIPEFLETLRVFFGIVQAANFKLNAAKSSLFELEIKWCGRLISSDGIRHDPERVSALAELPLPSTIAELQYFVCATNWLHDSLPDYARLIAPLQDKLNAERKRIGRRNRNALNVATSWTGDEEAAFDSVVNLVWDSALMAFPDPAAEMLLFTDASALGYSIIVTQVRNWDPLLPVDQQQHEMIVCKFSSTPRKTGRWWKRRRSRSLKLAAILNTSFFVHLDSGCTVTTRIWRTFLRLELSSRNTSETACSAGRCVSVVYTM